jgi:hypothetical protein
VIAMRHLGHGRRPLAVALLLGLCGPAWSGPAGSGAGPVWIETYRDTVHPDAAEIQVIRDDDRLEERRPGAPVRVWRRLPDGIELRELHPDRGEAVVFAPGDLRALGHVPAWDADGAEPLKVPGLERRSRRPAAPGEATFTPTDALHEIDGIDDAD